MHITKEMLHDDLQERYWPMKITGYIMAKVWILKLINRLSAAAKGKNIDTLHCEEKYISSRSGGPDIRLRLFKPLNTTAELPGLLYLHGGGYLIGNPETFLGNIEKFINARPCVVIAPDYRKALQAPYPAAFNDCYDTLLWMKENAPALGLIPDTFIVGGHSAGGGLTAAVSLKAADTSEVDIAFQMPVYPMIDDRQTTESAANSDAPVWNTTTNNFGWSQYLRGLKEKNLETPTYAAPSRATDYSKLPPTITFVGDLEPFRDETIEYVENLKKAGIPVEFELFKGCVHGFEQVAPDAEISKTAWKFLLDKYSDFVDQFFGST
jgi:acetyl esterase/lipase